MSDSTLIDINFREEEVHEETETEQETFEKESAASSTDDEKINFDTSSMKCFKQIDISSSSIFKNPLYFFPDLQDPGIYEAFRYEPPLYIDNDVGRERYLAICKELKIVPLKRVLTSLDEEELDLSFYGLRHNELRAIFHVLEVNEYVKELDLRDSSMSEDTVHLLSRMLSLNQTLKKLSLKQCYVGAKGAQALNEGLQSNVILQELDLSFNSIGDTGLRSLRLAFKNNESLIKIDLSHNNLTSASAVSLQQLFTNHEMLQDVNLAWNILCDDESFKKIGIGLRKNPCLTTLNLAWNNLESIVVAKELGKFIRESTTLEFLDLSNNGFKEIPAAILKNAINASTTLEVVRFGNNPLNPNEVAAFGNVLLQSEYLKILDLENLYFPRSFNPNFKKIDAAGKKLIYGGVICNFRIKGPNKKEVILRRCHYLGLAPKRAKAKRDFGHIVLSFPEEIMDKGAFEQFVRKKKKGKMYDIDLLDEIQRTFPSGKKKIDTKRIISEYMKLYPDTKLPPPKPKKPKKGKKKKKKTPLTSTTGTSLETNLESSTIPNEFEGDSSPYQTDTEEDGQKNKSEDEIQKETNILPSIPSEGIIQGEGANSLVKISEEVDVVEI